MPLFIKNNKMEVFGKHIFGSDAQEFKDLPVLEQVNWIKTYTKQQNDDLINEFLSNIVENNDKNCINCGNISKTIPTETTAVVENSESTKNSRRRDTKRKRNDKRS